LVDYTHDIDEDIIDALFDRDYVTLEKLIKALMSEGFDALQTVTDSEMIVAFPGTQIEVVSGTEL
jgi:DNA-binding protein YbaB